jgi:tRNA threonylcarbamoyladenosine biosynthesis protein TsaB
MIVLAFDTAGPRPAVALRTPGSAFEEALPEDRRASEELLPAVRRVLSSAGISLRDCGRIAACAGPGSFTGVRVGLAMAWGIARASGVAFEAVSTLEALAEASRPSRAGLVVCVLDAGRGDRVCERFALAGERARSLAPPVVLKASAVRAFADGDPIGALPGDLLEPPVPAPPTSLASALAAAVARRPREGVGGGEAPSAIYARPSAAEEKHGAA